MFWIIILSFAVLIALAVMIYMLPTDPAVKAKRRKVKEKRPVLAPESAAIDTSKDWKSIAERWEKHNNSLQGEIEKMKMDRKRDLQMVDERESKARELVDKLALEKGWREKEQETIEKIKLHEKNLKDQIFRTESDLEKEHSKRLRLERELQDIKIKYDQIFEEKRQLSIKANTQQTTLESNTRELRELKSENAQLKEKRADIQWVAKSEFDELKKAFDAKEQELLRLKQSHG
jgi:predicted nuclease with TOPRIM domain